MENKIGHLVPPEWMNETILRNAYERIKSNPANYGTTWATTLDLIDAKWFRETSELLRKGLWEPQPVKRVWIPKIPKGVGRIEMNESGARGRGINLFPPEPGTPKRPLGVPSPRDKIVQEALREHLERLFADLWSPHSFAYRRGIGVQQALKHLCEADGMRLLIEGDLKGYFDSVPHDKLLSLVRSRADGQTTEVVKRILSAGVIDPETGWEPTVRGTPQGGVISPLLANLYLTPFDYYVETILAAKYPENRIHYARYADDWIIGLDSQGRRAEHIRELCRRYLEGDLGLKLNLEKTKITRTRDGGNFLGFTITRMRTKGKLRRGNQGRLIALVNLKESQTWEKVTLRGMLKIQERIKRGYKRKWELRSFVEAAREELGHVRLAENKKEIESKIDGLFWAAVMHACVQEGSRDFQKWNEIGVKRYKALKVLSDLKKFLYSAHVRERGPPKTPRQALKERCEGNTIRCSQTHTEWGQPRETRVYSIDRMPLRAKNLLESTMKKNGFKHLSLCRECAVTMVLLK